VRRLLSSNAILNGSNKGDYCTYVVIRQSLRTSLPRVISYPAQAAEARFSFFAVSYLFVGAMVCYAALEVSASGCVAFDKKVSRLPMRKS